ATHDNVKGVVPGPPAEAGADALGGGNDDGRIAGPAGPHAHIEVAAGHAPDRLDHLQHREAAAVAAIEDVAVAAGAQVRQGRHVCLSEIGDVDVVAHAGAVGRGVVGAELLHVAA